MSVKKKFSTTGILFLWWLMYLLLIFLKLMLWTVLATHVIGPACYSIPHLIKAPPFLPRYSSPILVPWVCTWSMSGSVPNLCGHKNELYRDGYVPKSGLLWVFFWIAHRGWLSSPSGELELLRQRTSEFSLSTCSKLEQSQLEDNRKGGEEKKDSKIRLV